MYNKDDISEIKRNMSNNSLKSHGAESFKASKKRKTKIKIDYKKMLRNVIIIFAMIGMFHLPSVQREIDLQRANHDIKTRIESMLIRGGIQFSKENGKIDILNTKENMTKLFKFFGNAYNFNEEETLYAISTINSKDFDEACQYNGYEGYQDFLNEKYPQYNIDDSGAKINTGGSYKVFENMVQEDYVGKVEDIRKMGK